MEEQNTEKSKPGIGRKILKAFLWLLAIGLVVVVVALASSPLWLGPLAKNIANDAVPKVTGCEFTLDELSINPFTGRVFIRECHLKNPKGYKAEEAFSVSTVVVDVAVCSLLSDEIHVETIEIRKLYASYLSDSKGINNFDRIVAVASGRDPEAKLTDEEIAAKKAEKAAAEAEKKAKEESGETGPKVVIDHFELTDSEVSYGVIRGTPPITLPLPSVKLDNIGKEKEGGFTLAEAGNTIWQACLQVAGSAGEQVRKLGNAVGAAAGAAADAVGNVAGAAAGAVGDVAGAVGDAAGAAAGVVGDAAGAAVGAVGNAAGAVGDAVGNAAGKAADAAGKAMKSIGGLFSGDAKDKGKDDSK